jgi:hypothetical protein
VTADYGKALNTRFNVVSDPWPWSIYSVFYSDHQRVLPAAVVQDDKNQTIQIFSPGIDSPEEVVALILEKLK